MGVFEFRRHQRLLHSREFDRVFKQPFHRFSSAEFLLLAADRADADDPCRLGLVIGKKAAGNAVQRNRIKRLIRETFRQKQFNVGMDVIVVARPGVKTRNRAEIAMTLRSMFEKLAREPLLGA